MSNETTSPRELLDCLGRDTLVRLIAQRNLAPSRENDERRKTLSYSYRGDVEALVHDLNRAELITLFNELSFFVSGEEVYLSNPAKYRLDELRSFAVRGFVGRRVRTAGDFSPISDLDDDDENVSDNEPDSSMDEDDKGSAPNETPDDDAFGDLSKAWSRPRMLSRIMTGLGLEVPQRLRTPRFGDVIVALRKRGIEASLADDPQSIRLAYEAESPGIKGKLRLRRAFCPHCHSANVIPIMRGLPTPDASLEEENGEIALGGCIVTDDDDEWKCRSCDTEFGRPSGSMRVDEPVARARESFDRRGGPPIVVRSGERPVSQRVPRPSDYKLAVLRLQFLTAVPTVERASMPAWPTAYLEAATKGLQLRPEESRLLRALSTGLCFGNHSPYDAIPQLTQVMEAVEWQQLIADFVALNPFQPDFVRVIVDQVAPVDPSPPTERGTSWRPVEVAATPDDFREPPVTKAPSVAPQAAVGRASSTTERTPEAATNVRDLGALSKMFEDD